MTDSTINGLPNEATSLDGTENFVIEDTTNTTKRSLISTLLSYINNSIPTTYVPQNSKSTNYTTVISDAGRHLYHPSADTSSRTFTIASNATVAYPIGTTITFVNDTGAGNIVIAVASDVLVFADTGVVSSVTLANNGIATAIKITSTRWMISGAGLS
jgi:hypothetical protein